MKTRQQSILLALIFSCGAFIYAPLGLAQNYFAAEVPVKSQSSGERKQAATAGMRQVLLRVSGSQEAVYGEGVFDALDKAHSYVEQFSYGPVPVNDLGESEYGPEYTEMVRFEFAPKVIRRVLREAGERFWPTNRPEVLVWLVEDDIQYGRQLVNPELAPELSNSLRDVAWERGLPLEFPLLDLDDNIALPADTAWAMDEDAILLASERYAADVVLVGRLIKTSTGQIRSTWQFFHAQSTLLYDNDGNGLANGFTDFSRRAIYPLADFLANRYAIQLQDMVDTGIALEMEGVRSFGEYRQVMNYLENLAAVSQVQVKQINEGKLRLMLMTETDVKRLKTAFQLDRKLVEVESETQIPRWQQVEVGTWDNPLRYRWQ